MRSANGSSSELRPTTAWQATPALAAAGGHLAHDLALEALLVEAALAGDHEGRVAHEAVEAERVEHEGGAGHEPRSARCPEPAREPAGGAGHRLAARDRAASPPASSASRRSSRVTVAGVGPLLRREHARGVLERRAHVADHLEVHVHARLVERLQRPGAAVGGGRAAHRHHHALGAGRGGRRDQLARCRACSPARRRARPPPRAPARSPAPSPRARCGRPRSSANSALTGRPSGSLTVALRRSPSSVASSTSIVPSPPSATGSSTASRPAAAQARGDGGRHLGGAEGALEAVRGDERGAAHSSARRRCSAASPCTAKTIRSSAALVLARDADHDPRRLLEREAAHAGAEGHQRQRAAAEPLRRRRASSAWPARRSPPRWGRRAPSWRRGSPSGRAGRRRWSPPPRRARSAHARPTRAGSRARRRARSRRPRRRRGRAACWRRWRSRPPPASSRPPAPPRAAPRGHILRT